MQKLDGSVRFVRRWPSSLVTVFLLFLLWQPPTAGAGTVSDVVKDLYGGDGILLRDIPLPPGAPPEFQHAPHFTASSLQGLDNLSTALSSNLGLFAFNSTVTGFTFDIERGVPVRTTESLGPLLGERAPTLGAKKLNIAFSYTRINFKRFEGTELDDLSLTFTHKDVNEDGILGPNPPELPLDFETDVIAVDLDLEIEQDVLALFATYGVTRNWDVGVVVPFIHSRVRAEANATIIRNATGPPPFPDSNFFHNFDPSRDASRSVVDREKTGIGDVILRTKYNFLRKQPRWPDLAIVGRVKLPTGDEDELLGTGETNLLGLLVASQSFDRVTPHLNLGYEVTTDPEQNNLRYAAGFDARLSPELTAAVDAFGRWEPAGDGIGDHTVDLAFGIKWNPFGRFLLNANVQVPLNINEGLRADVIWTIGTEMTF